MFDANLTFDQANTALPSYEFIEGSSGGKGGSGAGGNEAPNTLQNNTLVQVLHLLGEGPIQGLHTGDGQSIFLNQVALQGAGNTWNFQGASFTLRNGTANQEYIPGFANVTATFPIGTQIFAASPVVYTVSSIAVDAVTLTLDLVNGLREIDTSGNINGYEVGIKVESKPHSSNTWTALYNVLKQGKTNSAYDWQIYVIRPAGAVGALWDVRVTRTTPDDNTANVTSVVDLTNVVETQEIQESYDTFAVLGMSLNAEQFGTSLPTISFLLDGVTIDLPSNYNPVTRTYSGDWDGTFTTGFSNNPAWVLYDLLTNTQYGGGVYGITPDTIDKFSFYNAGVFCDAPVPNGTGGSNTEPRFTFDAPVQSRTDFWSAALQIAGMMNANLLYAGGLVTLNQDRPANSVMAISKTNVIAPDYFTYVGTPLNTRTTAVNVTYADKTNYYYPKVTPVSNTAAANVYGFNSVDFAAFGATSEGQAIRAGKWELFFSLNTTETVNFKMGQAGNFLQAGDVVDIFDEDYAQQAGAGRILAANTNTVWLDQPVVISGSSPQIGINLPDGVTYAYYNITNTPNTTSNVISISNTFSEVPQFLNDYIILSAIKPRTFKITDIKQGTNPGELDFNAYLYNSGNYAFIEEGINLPTSPYSLLTTTSIGDPTDVEIGEMASNIQNGEAIRRGLLITWQPPIVGTASTYNLKWRFNRGSYKTVAQIPTTAYDLENLAPGDYDFVLQSVASSGLTSGGNTFSYTISVAGNTASTLLAPTNFTVNGSGNSFTGQDIHMEWLNPANNVPAFGNNTLLDFRLDIMDATFSNVLGTYFIDPVASNTNQSFLYTLADNIHDYGIPERTVYAALYSRDTAYNLSTGNRQIFQNPAPATMTGTVTPVANGTFIGVTYPNDPDIDGVLIWRGTSNTFTLANSSLIYNGFSNKLADTGLTTGTEYWYRWAAYDSFFNSTNGPFDGTGLNVSASVGAIPVSFGLPGGPTLPGSAANGTVFFDTTDNQLYRWTGTAWTNAVPNTALTGLITTTQISNNAISTPQLQAGSVTTAVLAAGAVTANNLAVNSVIAGKIAAFAVTTGTIDAGAVTAGTIAAGSIVATDLDILSSGGTSIDMANGVIQFNNGSFMKVIGTGFGVSSEFIEWYGPTRASISTCDRVNAIAFLTTSGDAYFGGALLAGILNNSSQGTILSPDNICVLGPFASEGNTITITWSSTMQAETDFPGNSTGLTNYNATTKQSPNCVIQLQRSVGGGSFVPVANLSITGGHNESAPIPADLQPGFYRQSWGGSSTFTDTLMSTSSRTYKVIYTSGVNNNINSTETNDVLAIQSVEVP